MSFIPYSRQHVEQSDIDAVVAVLGSDFLTQGPAIPFFERAFADRHQVPHALAVSNATAALHIALLALGVGPGARVWTSPNSFVASANAALYCGATVDFVDIDPISRNLSVAKLAEKLEAAEREGTLPQVIVPVDFAGLPADIEPMRKLADRYGFSILEDASHATGASYRGKPVGSAWADITVFSFHAVKIVTTGEGGMLTTHSDELAHRLTLLRSHGITRQAELLERQDQGAWYYEQQMLGWNYRMTDIQAALGTSQLARMDAMRDARQAIADRYDRLLSALPVFSAPRSPESISAWHLYVVELDTERCAASRRAVFDAMRRAEIGVNVHYIPIYMQPYYRHLGFSDGYCPVAERYYNRALTLPLFPAMSSAQQDKVVSVLEEALQA